MSIKIEIPGDYLEIFFVANGECMWKYGRILQFLVANATILVAMYSVGGHLAVTYGGELLYLRIFL